MREYCEHNITKGWCGTCYELLESQLTQSNARIMELEKVVEAARGIKEIGKRDMSNTKYDCYFEELHEALAQLEQGEDTKGEET